MNNLDELSKPVAEVNSKYGDPEAFGERELKVLADIQKIPYRTKFYSQEYVDSLLVNLEAAEKEINDWRSIAEASAQDDADWRKLADSKNELISYLAQGIIQLKQRAEAAEVRLLVPWIKRSEQMPDPKDKRRVCVFTPNTAADLRYRLVPANLFKAVCSSATHWHYVNDPVEGGE
ncbi:TPA: hypothetical protein SJ159_003123 [Yersinia enterocolitica]|nr:hypothetical protein [Yersinia enterocolitica]